LTQNTCGGLQQDTCSNGDSCQTNQCVTDTCSGNRTCTVTDSCSQSNYCEMGTNTCSGPLGSASNNTCGQMNTCDNDACSSTNSCSTDTC
jgi:hypothetical protein